MTAASLLPSLPANSRVLVIRLRSIGDIVLLTPALHLLKQWRPDLRVSVLVEPGFRDLLEGNPDLDEILTLGRGVAARLRTISGLRRREFALCLNLHGGPTSVQLTSSSGAQWKAGFAHFRTRRAYDFLVPDARTILGQPTVHTAEHQASALFWLGLPRCEIPRARLFVAPRAKAWWQETRATIGVLGRDYALIHPTALYQTKQWAPENFARLGAYLEQAAGLEALYSCGPGESAVLEEVQRAARSQIRRLEDASLAEFTAALAGARVFVGNDSGPAHMAAALGRPTVVIFGSSSSQIWRPWPPRNATARVVQNSWECNPCPGDHCYRFERPECILSVQFEQVRAAVEAVLKGVRD